MSDREEIKLRYKYIRVSLEFIVRFLSGKLIGDEIQNPLPRDARVIRHGYDAMGNLMLIIESNEFEEVDIQGEVPPFSNAGGDIFFRKHYGDKVN